MASLSSARPTTSVFRRRMTLLTDIRRCLRRLPAIGAEPCLLRRRAVAVHFADNRLFIRDVVRRLMACDYISHRAILMPASKQ